MSVDSDAKWREFLDPNSLRPRLIAASLFLAAFEILRDSIIERIRAFLASGPIDTEGDINLNYNTEVMSRNRSPVYSSLSWLVDRGAIDQSDLETFERLKACRNRLAHEFQDVVLGASSLEHLDLFPNMIELLRKIEVWWITNVEIPSSPEFDGTTIDEREITSGTVIILQIMLDVALAPDQSAGKYLEALNRFGRNH